MLIDDRAALAAAGKVHMLQVASCGGTPFSVRQTAQASTSCWKRGLTVLHPVPVLRTRIGCCCEQLGEACWVPETVLCAALGMMYCLGGQPLLPGGKLRIGKARSCLLFQRSLTCHVLCQSWQGARTSTTAASIWRGEALLRSTCNSHLGVSESLSWHRRSGTRAAGGRGAARGAGRAGGRAARAHAGVAPGQFRAEAKHRCAARSDRPENSAERDVGRPPRKRIAPVSAD